MVIGTVKLKVRQMEKPKPKETGSEIHWDLRKEKLMDSPTVRLKLKEIEREKC